MKNTTRKRRKKNRKVGGSELEMKRMVTVIRPVLLLPPLLLMLIICFWVMACWLPLSFLHACVQSRWLNAYYVSVSTVRFSQQTVVFENDTINFADDVETLRLRVESHDLKIESPLLNESVNGHGVVALKRERPTTHVEISAQGKPGAVSNELTITGNKSNDGEKAAFAQDLEKMYIETIRTESMPAGMKGPSQKQCRGRQIYAYDLPKKFNTELVEQCHSLIPWFSFCDYFTDGGMGKPIENFYEHCYQTHQYALELVFHSRISRHPCLVSNPGEANLFYIPYYGGLDVIRWNLRKNISNEKRDELALELVNWLQGQPWWRRNRGRDHVLVLGKISWDFRRWKDTDTWGSRLLHLPEMKSITKLLIERNPLDMDEIGIPHPTFFHPRSDNDIWQWQIGISKSQRPHLISFAGAPRPKMTENIRSILIEQCSSRPEACKFLNCNSNVCLSPESTVKLFMKSEFCLQPPGDSPTRKSVFDSLIAGCIPVLFNPFTAYYQYPWHLPANQSSYSVYVPEESVKQREINVIEVLQKIPDEQRKEMRKTIIQEIMPGLVYGDPESRFDEFQDAFMISLNNIFWRLAKADISMNSSQTEAT